MPWNQVELMDQREEFIKKVLLPGSNISMLCKHYRISRKTAYKWLSRYDVNDLSTLADQSKRPKRSPNKVIDEIERVVVAIHKKNPYWGARKLHNYLLNKELRTDIPSISTIARCLKRNGCEIIKNHKSQPATGRFERSQPNMLWQMDFKGSFMTHSHRCFPLSIIDDYSRYSVGLSACKNERRETVKSRLIACFKVYGMPDQINVDNGNPWGNIGSDGPTQLVVWLMKHGVRVTHSSPYHPQTNGKVERFHRTLKLELLHKKMYTHCEELQKAFDQWLHIYNYERPHDALGGQPPSTRYACSHRCYSENLMSYEYDAGDEVRKVHSENGLIRIKGKRYRVGKGLSGEHVAIKATDQENEVSVFFMDYFIKRINLREGLD